MIHGDLTMVIYGDTWECIVMHGDFLDCTKILRKPGWFFAFEMVFQDDNLKATRVQTSTRHDHKKVFTFFFCPSTFEG